MVYDLRYEEETTTRQTDINRQIDRSEGWVWNTHKTIYLMSAALAVQSTARGQFSPMQEARDRFDGSCECLYDCSSAAGGLSVCDEAVG